MVLSSFAATMRNSYFANRFNQMTCPAKQLTFRQLSIKTILRAKPDLGDAETFEPPILVVKLKIFGARAFNTPTTQRYDRRFASFSISLG